MLDRLLFTVRRGSLSGGLCPGSLCTGGLCLGGVSVQVGVSIRETPWKETPSPLWTEWQTWSKNITLPQTSFADGNKKSKNKQDKRLLFCLCVISVRSKGGTRDVHPQGYKFFIFIQFSHQGSELPACLVTVVDNTKTPVDFFVGHFSDKKFLEKLFFWKSTSSLD